MAVETIATTLKNREAGRTTDLIPLYLRENAAAFIAFLEHYYIFMSQSGGVDTFNLVDRGSGYIEATDVPTKGGHGVGLTVDIFVQDDTGVSSFTINKAGVGYETGDLIYIMQEDISPIATNATFTVNEVVAEPTQVINRILKEHDIDETKEEYLDNLGLEIARNVPSAPQIDRRTLFKNITKYYNTRGSVDSIYTFFKVFYDEDVLVYNGSEPWTYVIRTGLSGAFWTTTYDQLVHPAGMLYIIEFFLEIFADNIYAHGEYNKVLAAGKSLGTIEYLEGYDSINTTEDDWQKNLVIPAGNHTPTLQIGWLRALTELWIEILSDIAASDIVTPKILNDGYYKKYNHANGLLVIPSQVSTTTRDELNYIGNADMYVGIAAPLESSQGTSDLDSAFLRNGYALSRSLEYIEDEIYTKIYHIYWPQSYIDSISDKLSIWWDKHSQIWVHFSTNSTRFKIYGLNNAFGYGTVSPTPIVMNSNGGSVGFNNYYLTFQQTAYVSDLNIIQFKGYTPTAITLGSHYFQYNVSSDRVNANTITLSFYIDWGLATVTATPSGNIAITATNGIENLSTSISSAGTLLYPGSVSPGDPHQIRHYQSTFTFEDNVDNLTFTIDTSATFIYAYGPKDPYGVFVRNGSAYNSGYDPSFNPIAMNESYITDQRTIDIVSAPVVPVAGGAYTSGNGDGTTGVRIDMAELIDESIIMRTHDFDYVNTFYKYEYEFIPNTTSFYLPRYISWETTFDDLKKISGDDDVYWIEDFGETPIINNRGTFWWIINHLHPNTLHYEGDYYKGTI